jgi:hypothetical protein
MVLCGDQAFCNQVKHLDIKYHWIQEHVENGELIIGLIPSSGNIVDILTKALPSLKRFGGWVLGNLGVGGD